MDEDMIIISARLKAIRKEHKLTQQAFADKFGISQSSYSGYESGTIAPTLFFLIQVAKEYNISMDYLTGISKEKKGLQADEDIKIIQETIFNPLVENEGDKTKALKEFVKSAEQQMKTFQMQISAVKNEIAKMENASEN